MSDASKSDSETTSDAPIGDVGGDQQATRGFVSSRDFEPTPAGGDEPSVVPKGAAGAAMGGSSSSSAAAAAKGGPAAAVPATQQPT
ncbi:MAG: hypothetical protein KDC46_14505, partial [Thermoleophilia bacterium]|nr:hypothetical protein [Thermoleophilia bacterium]